MRDERSPIVRSWPIWAIGGLLWVPLLRAGVEFTRIRWAPLYDMALFAMRVRDVGTSNTPMLGLAGRLSTLPDVGCHPGPLAFYAFAPLYRMLGGSFWALRTTVTASAAAAMLLSLVIGWRRRGVSGVIAVGVMLAIIELGLGVLTFTEPWNPYVPAAWFVTFLLTVWSVFDGDVKFLPAAAAIGSFCCQTHISYLPVCGGLSALAFVVVFRRWRRSPESWGDRPLLGAALAWTAGVVAIAWTPPLVEEWLHPRGNFTVLFDHFRHPPEPVIGIKRGVNLLLQHVDMWSFARESFRSPGVYREAFTGSTRAAFGGCMLAAWLASSAATRKLGDRALRPLQATVAAALSLSFIAESRIIGFPYSHLVFFAWCTGALLLLSIVLNLGALLGGSLGRHAPMAAWVAGGLFTLAFVVRVTTGFDVAASKHSGSALQLAALARGAVQSLHRLKAARSGGDPAGYSVTWHDSLYGGAQGYGLLMEFERADISAFVADNDFNRALVGAHRVLDPGKAAGRIDISNGGWVIDMAKQPGAVMLAYADVRTPSQRTEYQQEVVRLTEELGKIGRTDLVPQIERNFQALTVSGLSPWNVFLAGRLVQVGAAGAVFLLPK